MSIFSVLGNIGKGVAKGVLTVGKVGVNVAANQVGIGSVFSIGGSSASNAAPVASAETPSVQQSSGSLVDSLKGLFGATTQLFLGKTHLQVDGHIGAGGTADEKDQNNSSGLPSWLVPAGLGLGAILLIKNSGNSRRS